MTHRQFGLTIIEMMIAMLIGTLLISGLIQILAANRATFRTQESMARVLESARFTLDILTGDIRQAGYIGCDPLPDQLITALRNPPASFAPESGLQGWEYIADGGTAPGDELVISSSNQRPSRTNGNSAGWTGWSNQAGGNALDSQPKVIPGTDVIRVWVPDDGSASVIEYQPTASIDTSARILVNTNHTVEVGDVVLLSDCTTSQVMQVCDIENGAAASELLFYYHGSNCPMGNNLGQLPSSIMPGAELVALTSKTYFIGKKAGKGDNPPSLYYATLNQSRRDGSTGTPVELIEGIESLQITYGEDTDNNGLIDRYSSADRVNDWRNILVVRIGILVRSQHATQGSSRAAAYDDTFNVNGTEIRISPADNFLRQVFNASVQLRNREM